MAAKIFRHSCGAGNGGVILSADASHVEGGNADIPADLEAILAKVVDCPAGLKTVHGNDGCWQVTVVAAAMDTLSEAKAVNGIATV